MAKKRKKTIKQRGAFYPNRYIKEKSRSFPISRCLYTPGWDESGLCQVLVIRKQPSGLYLYGFYLLDMWCLGIKNTVYNINHSEEEMEDFIATVNSSSEYPLETCEYVFAHNLIYGAWEYAEELGFSPHTDFYIGNCILEIDSDDIELIEFEFGKEGKPFFVSGPYDDSARIHKILEKSVGTGNYDSSSEI